MRTPSFLCLAVVVSVAFLSACGGSSSSSPSAAGSGSNSSGGGDSGIDESVPPTYAFAPEIAWERHRKFHLTWDQPPRVTHYKVLENPDGLSGFTQVGEDIPGGTAEARIVVPLVLRSNAQYMVRACNAAGCVDSPSTSVQGNLAGAIGYLKASNAEDGDYFGYAVSVSADGNTLAAGAYYEDSSDTGVGGSGADNDTIRSGAAYVFRQIDGEWVLDGFLKSLDPDADDSFGYALSLSADGKTLAVGSYRDDGGIPGIDTDPADNSGGDTGAVYVYTRQAAGWEVDALIRPTTLGGGDQFGEFLSLSGDGKTLAVGVPREDSDAAGINGDESDNSFTSSGAVFVFAKDTGGWSQEAYIKPELVTGYPEAERDGDYFGEALDLSFDGDTLVVGAKLESSTAVGVNDVGDGSTTSGSGAVFVFTRDNGSWSQDAYLKASNADVLGYQARFGSAVAISGDGQRIAVGANNESSGGAGVGGGQTTYLRSGVGAVFVFAGGPGNWSQEAYIKSEYPDYSFFGDGVALNHDGTYLAIGASWEDNAALGVNGREAVAGTAKGSIALYKRDASWQRFAYLKSYNANEDGFGRSVAMADDLSLVAAGLHWDDGNGQGTNGDPDSDDAVSSGAVLLY